LRHSFGITTNGFSTTCQAAPRNSRGSIPYAKLTSVNHTMIPAQKYLFVFIICALMTQVLVAQDRARREILRTNEKGINVSVKLSFGSIFIGKGTRDKILVADYPRRDDDREDLKITYDVSAGEGNLVIRSTDKAKWWSGSSGEKSKSNRRWSLELTDAVPISLHIELGAGEGDLDITGLQIAELRISSGASAVRLACDEPNRIMAERISFESGVGSFSATDLGNTNFRTLKFEGGVGAYKLDFGGALRRSGEVDINVGLGAITVIIPEKTPTQLRCEDSWLSSVDIDDIFQKTRKGRYETPTYNTASEKLTIKIESGFGKVKVKGR